jgi:hypothetical protein
MRLYSEKVAVPANLEKVRLGVGLRFHGGVKVDPEITLIVDSDCVRGDPRARRSVW